MRDERLEKILAERGKAELVDRLSMVEEAANWSFQANFYGSPHGTENGAPTALWVQKGRPIRGLPYDPGIVTFPDEFTDPSSPYYARFGTCFGSHMFANVFTWPHGPSDWREGVAFQLGELLDGSYLVLGETEADIMAKVQRGECMKNMNLRAAVASRDARLADAMDILERYSGLRFELFRDGRDIVLSILFPNNLHPLLTSRDGDTYIPHAVVGSDGALSPSKAAKFARKFTYDAFATIGETEASARMKMELRGEMP